MSFTRYPPTVIARVLRSAFLPRRGLSIEPRGLAPDGRMPDLTDDGIIRDMEMFGYVRIDARRAVPRGARDWVVVLLLCAEGKYAHHGPDLRKLLDGVCSEKLAREDRLDELIVIVEEPFFSKKNLTDVIGDLQAGGASAADPAGTLPYYNAYPDYAFSSSIFDHECVPPHRVLSPDEVTALLASLRCSLADLPRVPVHEPPIIWIEGREGQVVEIIRDSQVALKALYYRRIEKIAQKPY